MDVLVGVLIILAHTYSANGVPLEKPLSLLVLSADLLSLEYSLPIDSWVEDRVIKYDDELRFIVKQYSSAAEEKFLLVDGEVTLAKLKWYSKPGSNVHRYQVRRLFFHNGLFYFEDSAYEPVLEPEEYLIVDYQPTERQIYLKPAIEYIPRHQLDIELINSIPKISHESKITGAAVIKTYFRMAEGVKIYAEYDLVTKMVVFKGNFQIITTGLKDLYKMSVNLQKIQFDLQSKDFIESSMLGKVFGVRVTSIPKSEIIKDVYLRITRKHLLKDLLESSPTHKMSSSNIFGMIKYENFRIFSLNYIETNQRLVLRVTGRFVTQDGDDLCCICVATPEDQRNNKSAILSDETVLFSCSPGSTWDSQILLQEDTDYIATMSGYSIVLADFKKLTRDSKKPTRIEPYLDYLSHQLFRRTLIIVSDAMKIKCASGYHRKSFRLFLNVFLVYDCNTGIALFDPLDLWLSPGRLSSFVGEYPHVSYHSKAQHFTLGDKVLSVFKLRQLYPIFPDKLPGMIKYMYDTNYGNRDIVIHFKSLEWDLHNIRKNVFKAILPGAFGIVRVDDDVLIRADISQEMVDGEKRLMVIVKGLYHNCLRNECEGEYQLVYDGWKLIAKDSRGLESGNMLDKLYVPKTFKLPMLEHILVAHEERYVTLSSFSLDMFEMTTLLYRRCEKLRGTLEYDETLTIYVYYFGSKEPVIGYYDCKLKYVSFFSKFKVIKYPNVDGKSISYRPGEELKFTQSNPEESFSAGNSRELIFRPTDLFDAEEEEIRRKYSDYILRDLIYDQIEKSFHSKSHFLAEVYALRLLPKYTKEDSSRKGGYNFKLNHRAKVFVYGQDAPKSAWM